MESRPEYNVLVAFPAGQDGDTLAAALSERGMKVTRAQDIDASARAAESSAFDMAVMSILIAPDPEAALRRLLAASPDLMVVIASPFERAQAGVTLVGKGAKGSFPWPSPQSTLDGILKGALSRLDLEKARGHMLELAELWEIAKAQTSGIKSDEVLGKILDSAIRVTGADSGSIMLLDENRTSLTIAASRGIDPGMASSVSVPVGQGISGWVAREGRPLLLRKDRKDFERFQGVMRRGHIKSSLCAPIKNIRAEIIGTLSLNNETGARAFNERSLGLMTIYAAEAGSVIQAARAFEDLSKAHENLRTAHEKLKSIQSQLVQAAKMAAVGMLASGIAHEFNNLLTGIMGMAQLARETGKDKHVQKAIDVAISNSEKAKAVVQNLLRFSSQFKKVRETVDVRDLVEETLSMMERDFEAASVEVVREYGEVPPIRANRGEIQQVLLNILINARQAIGPAGGRVAIAVRGVGQEVHISVSDTGCGIPEENLPRIFEPFFSTKSILGGGSEQGSGLGLSVSYGIIKGHGGSIRVESALGTGTTFTIELPVNPPRDKNYTDRLSKAKGGAALETGPISQSCAPAVPGPVLVVDDEWWVREFLKEALSEIGVEVMTAEDGDTAVEMARQAKPGVVFLDLVIPGPRGSELASKILEVRPDARIILMTGKVGSIESIEASLREGISGYLQKPFEVQDVLNVLGAGGSPNTFGISEAPEGCGENGGGKTGN